MAQLSNLFCYNFKYFINIICDPTENREYLDNEEQIKSGCPIDGAISVRVDGGFGSYRWFVYITTLLLQDASWILILHCGPPELPQRHLYC